MALFLAATLVAHAAGESVRGRVSDGVTREYLAGARVAVDSLGLVTYTDRDGAFVLPVLPAGSHVVRVTYPDRDVYDTPVTSGGARSGPLEIELNSAAIQLNVFTVTAERAGNALAFSQQRAADNVKNVISADALGNLAEGNAADLLQRLPGVVVDYTAADPREVRIRGISPELNSVLFDGVRVANAGSAADRTFSFSVMSNIESMESIEVIKALTPELDAASVGGAVNLKTKSALRSRVPQRYKFQLGGNIETKSDSSDRLQPTMSGSLLKIWGTDRKIGLMLSATYTPYFHGQDRALFTFQPTLNVPTHINRFAITDAPKTTFRKSFGGRIEAELSKTWTVFLNTNASFYRAVLDSRVFDVTTNAASVQPGFTETVTESRPVAASVTNLSHSPTNVFSDTLLLQPGGRHKWDTWEIDYNVSFSTAKQDTDTRGDRGSIAMRLPGVGWRVDRSSFPFPEFGFTSGPDATNLNNYSGLTYNTGISTTEDEVRGGQINLRKSFATARPFELKTGARFTRQERAFTANPYNTTYLGPDGVAGLNPASGQNDDNLAAFLETEYRRDPTTGGYPSPPWPSAQEVAQRFAESPHQFRPDLFNNERLRLQGDRAAQEEVAAAYAQGRLTLGRLSILSGVRMERTAVKGRGALQGPLLNTIAVGGQTRKETAAEANQRIRSETAAQRTARLAAETARRNADPVGAAQEEWGLRRHTDGSYENFFPSLHFRYEPWKNLVLRASYSTGIGRPNFASIIPQETVNYVAGIVTASNPDLEPQYADNFDLSAEYYLNPAGMVSVGLFTKDIRDFIFSDAGGIVPTGADNGFNGLYENFTLTTSRNGGKAKIRGIELAYSQQLTFLPGLLNGIGVFANFTRIETEGDYGTGANLETDQVAGFVPESGNLGLSFSYKRFSIRSKWLYKSDYLFAFSSNAAQSRFRPSGTRVDLSANFRLTKNFSLYADVVNLTNELEIFQRGPIAGRYDTLNNFGRKASFGITGEF